MGNKIDYKQRTQDLFKKKALLSDPYEIQEIRNQVVILNMPLVSTVLKKYRPYTEDQFQIGCIGLIKAADTYEMLREVPFSSYACFVIERELQMDFKERMSHFEEINKDNLCSTDDIIAFDNGDEATVGSMIEDVEATKFMEEFIEQNALEKFCNDVIRPSIKEAVARGNKSKAKIDFEVWEQLEFRYIMSIIFEESQKRRFNMTQMAKECNVSLPNLRNRHVKVMDSIFQRTWSYMALSFTELLERIRGEHNIPQKLLCLDPGKTTGWSFFECGQLTRWGQVDECYDDQNININGLMQLFKDLDPDFIVYEDYRVYSHKLDRHTYSPVMTVRLIGMIETYCQMNDIPTHKQMATTAKNFCTDDKLKQWGFWKQGMRHSRDAIRHGCYFLLFYKKGQDIF